MYDDDSENEDINDVLVNNDYTPVIYLGDAWFASVDLAYHSKQTLKADFIGVIKSNSGRYPKQFLQDKMKNWPGGSHLVLKTTIDGIDLFAIGYKYCKSKVLMFIMTKGAGHTEPGDPYIAKWVDENANQMQRRINRPDVLSFYFSHSNIVDFHNQQRQKELRLEKCWVTQDGYFRIITTLIGITVIDAWRAYRFHSNENHRHNNIELLEFADFMAYDMLKNNLPVEIIADSHTLLSMNTFSANPRSTNPLSQIEISTTSGDIHSEITFSPSNTNKNIPVFHAQVRMDVLQELEKHKIVQTAQVDHDRSKCCGWRPKRAICIEDGCKVRTSRYCEFCDSGRRDYYWLCKQHELEHQQKIISNMHNNNSVLTYLCHETTF